MDVDLEIEAGGEPGIGSVEPALGDHDVPIVGEGAERVAVARHGRGQGPREAHPGAALAADGEVDLLIDEASGAKIDPARRGDEFLGRRVDQLVHRRGRRGGAPGEEKGENREEEPERSAPRRKAHSAPSGGGGRASGGGSASGDPSGGGRASGGKNSGAGAGEAGGGAADGEAPGATVTFVRLSAASYE
jgi:hypothetical protein